MLVNAAQHPGPALFQGIGLILIAIFFLYKYWSDAEKSKPKAEPKTDDEVAFEYIGAFVFLVCCMLLFFVAVLVWIK
jgi:hypothetical protein